MTMRRIATTLLAGVFMFILFSTVGSETCEAQRARGWLQRNAVSNAASQAYSSRARPVFGQLQPFGQFGQFSASPPQPQRFPTEAYFAENRAPVISRILDGKMTHKYRNPAEVDSRYVGGFHQNHFNNIGIPSGDIGIRGNAYNWFTW